MLLLFRLDYECDVHCSEYVWILFHDRLAVDSMIKNDAHTATHGHLSPRCNVILATTLKDFWLHSS